MLILSRGTIGAYNQWVTRVGDATYSFESLLPYFQKSANFTPPNSDKRGPEGGVIYDPAAFCAL